MYSLTEKNNINIFHIKRAITAIFVSVLLFTHCGSDGSFGNSDDNSPPTAYGSRVTTLKNTSVDIILQGTDPDNQPLTFRISETPEHGTLTQKAYNIFRYTPETDYEGDDEFEFVINDGKSDSNSADVDIIIGLPNHPPVVANQELNTLLNNGINITLTASDADNDPIEINIIDQPHHGTVTFTEGTTYYYHPDNNYYGPDSFSYRVNDPYSTSVIATVKINVNFENIPPIAVEITSTINEDSPYVLPFSISGEPEIWDDNPTTYSVDETHMPGHGTVTFDAENSQWIYIPEANYNGTVTFYYRAYDGHAHSDYTLVTLNISPQPDAPAVADYTLIVTESEQTYTIPIEGTDPDGDVLKFHIDSSGLTCGNFSYTGGTSATYTSPEVSENYGLYTLTYTANDNPANESEGKISNTGYIYIVIRPKNVWFVNPANTGNRTGECWHQGFVYISDAVAEASAGDQIWLLGGTPDEPVTHTFKPGDNTVADLSGKVDIGESSGITIIGGFKINSYTSSGTNPTDFPTIIDGGNQVLHVIKAESFSSISNVTITGGRAQETGTSGLGGGIFIPDGKNNITINNITINNSYGVSGGGLYIGNGCLNITITDTTFTGNTSSTRGAGAAIGENAEVTLTRCNFTDNITEVFGGGLSNLGTVTALDSIFSNNQAQYGGGLYDHNNPSTYTNCTFYDNSASQSGGGIFNYGRINIRSNPEARSNSKIIDNSAPRGGGIFNDGSGIAGDADAYISYCTISGNKSTQNGAGIFNLHATVTIDNITTYNENYGKNEAGNDGGGIYSTENSSVTISSSSVIHNTAALNGGGIYSDGYSTLDITNSVINSNISSNGNGGGIYQSRSNSTLTDTEISGNNANIGNGGGVCLTEYSVFTFAGNYISENSALFGGGIYAIESTFSITDAHIDSNNFTIDFSTSTIGSGGGIYAEDSNVVLDSVYVEQNHGTNNILNQNYSGYHLIGCIKTIDLEISIPTYPYTYNERYGNYLDGAPDKYLNQFNPNYIFYTYP